MIGYVTLGTNDLPRAIKFYEELLSILGAKVFYESERSKAWKVSPDQPGLSVCQPFDGKPATSGNGTMVALAVDSKEKVDAMHKKALELGGKDEGAPGLRGPTYYGAYFRDLDGNKFSAFFIQQ